ncbi:hypothetical protein SALBM311S_08080 [Streptomyces alboniger]
MLAGAGQERPEASGGMIGVMDVTLHLAQDPEADALLEGFPLAALVGMLLDQQVPMEWAFKGPRTIADRLGGDDLDAHEIAAQDPEAFVALLSEKPAVHRYPGSMAKWIQQLCQYLVEHYDGRAELVWKGVDAAGSCCGASRSCPASASRRRRSSSPCWASSSVCAPRAGGRRRDPTANPSPSGPSPTSPAPTR